MIVYDMEVFKYDWFITTKDLLTNTYTKIHNDLEELKKYYEQHKLRIWAGHNINHYDNIILKALVKGIEGPELRNISNEIIHKDNGSAMIRKYKLNEVVLYPLDIMQDAIRYSLKEVEGYLGMSIEESSVSFDLDRKLTKEEIEEVFVYNQHDVDATVEEILLRADRLINKTLLLQTYDLPKSMIEYTNAKLCAEILQADYKSFKDGTQPYDLSVAPIDIKKYPECVAFFTDCDELDYTRKLEIDIANVPHILSGGGIHGAIENYFYEGEMWLVDVASYYPNMMINFNLCSRAMSHPDNFKKLVGTRMDAKELKAKYKSLAQEDSEKKKEYEALVKKYSGQSDALKLPINTTSGAMKAKFSKLFDERNNNWMCISGQLLLVDLIEHLEPYCELIQSNTDGIIIIPEDKENCDIEIKRWEDKTGLILEKTIATKIFQKDVNNYILLDSNGKVKTKGGFVAQYHNEERYADMFRRNLEIIDDAIVDYLLYDKSIEETIKRTDLPLLKYQVIKKLGSMYDDIVLYKYNSDGEIIYDRNVNKVNRILAIDDESYGKLMKKHNKKTTYDSVEGCPEHCLVLNSDIRDMTSGDIALDFNWYIELAKDRIIEFMLTNDDKKEIKTKAKELINNYKQEAKDRKITYKKLLEEKGLTDAELKEQVSIAEYENTWKEVEKRLGRE